MSDRQIVLRLPGSLEVELIRLAREEGVSINQFVVLAVAEKIAALQTIGYLEERARRGSREQLLEILAKAPDVEPEPRDRLD